MILIKSIEWYETEHNREEIYEIDPDKHVPIKTHTQEGSVAVECVKEIIRGRRFIRPSDGKDIYIGATAEAQDILGIMCEDWDRMERALSEATEEKENLKRKCHNSGIRLRVFSDATFWQRLRWLFFKSM